MPFFVQRIKGDGPPFTVAAVNVTIVPAHTVVPGTAVILTDGVRNETMVMVMELLAVSGTAHELLVICTVTTSPFAGV